MLSVYNSSCDLVLNLFIFVVYKQLCVLLGQYFFRSAVSMAPRTRVMDREWIITIRFFAWFKYKGI